MAVIFFLDEQYHFLPSTIAPAQRLDIPTAKVASYSVQCFRLIPATDNDLLNGGPLAYAHTFATILRQRLELVCCHVTHLYSRSALGLHVRR